MAFNLIELADSEHATFRVCSSNLELIPSVTLIPEPHLEMVCIICSLRAVFAHHTECV